MFPPYPNFAMFASRLLLFLLPATVFAQSSPAVVCFPGQCLMGYSNTTIGATLSASGLSVPLRLLPGTYSTTTNPQLLHDALISSSSSISPSSGFTNATSISLPLNIALQPGLIAYSGTLYSGSSEFQNLPTVPVVNTSLPLSYRSFALSNNVWMAVNTGPSTNNRVIVWDAIPDASQLPSSVQGSFALIDIQSAACSPGCSVSGGVCNASGTCQCQPGFKGASCDSCDSGFFGPKCQSCPANCKQCDEGINGSGRCLKPTVASDPSSCNCLNGVCGSNGQCTCNPGFDTGSGGLACSKCSAGFFQTSGGDCQICQIGCSSCADGNGSCQVCQSGFSKDANDATKCNPATQTTSSGVVCPSGSFANGAACARCATTCQTCDGATSNDCIVCATGLFTLNGACVSADSSGVCQGTSLIADNNKRECDTCGAKCTKCTIPNFGVGSTANQKQCTECLPGFFLSKGSCVETCPNGTTVSTQDNRTCIACDSSCSTCFGASTFCLTCSNNQLASNGRCVSTCPAGAFSSSGACLPCHPDCASCSAGGSFNQCSSCPSSRPILSGGRCLPTCAKNQFFDRTSGTCQKCDDTCSSCSAAGPSSCLACSGSSQVLRGGSCVASNCGGVAPGLGVCLSEFVITTASGASAPLPSVTGLNSPTSVSRGKRLWWWQIMLIVFACAFLLIGVLWCCSRRQRKKQKKEKKAELYAIGEIRKEGKKGLGSRIIRFVRNIFRRDKPKRRVVTIKPGDIVHLGPSQEAQSLKFGSLRDMEEGKNTVVPIIKYSSSIPPSTPERGEDRIRLLDSYRRPLTPDRSKYHPYHTRIASADRTYHRDDVRSSLSDSSSRVSAPSIYSEVTGFPRKTPESKMPVRREDADFSRYTESRVGVLKNSFR